MIYQDNSDAIDKINKEIAEKQKELLELVHGKKDYFECDDEMEELRQSKKLLLIQLGHLLRTLKRKLWRLK